MDKKDIIEKLNNLDLDKNEFWVIASSAMVMYGFKDSTPILELGCSRKLASKLEQKYGSRILRDGTRKITIDDNIEIFENWLLDEINYVKDIPVISIEGLKQMKRSLGKDDDFKDIAIINRYLAVINR